MQYRLRTLLILLAVLATWPGSVESAHRRRRGRLCQAVAPVQSQPERLGDMGPPDEKERKVNGILVVGSELTDAHVKAICRLTDDTKPNDFDERWLRGIIQTGPKSATHVWQASNYQKYQKLELVNGNWQIIETGAGLGKFS